MTSKSSTRRRSRRRSQGGEKARLAPAGREKYREWKCRQDREEDSEMHAFRHGSCRAREGVGKRKAKTRLCAYVRKKSDTDKAAGRGRNRLKRHDNDEETIRDKEKETELELVRCVYRSQMSGGNCAEGLLCRHLAAESSIFFHTDTHTQTNPFEESRIIPIGCIA